MSILSKPVERSAHLALLLAAAVLLGMHWMHLSADFPNYSRWMDWSKYTDEGWYGDAAIRHFQLGRWYVPGDFNPAAALPVWPFVEGLLFHVTGVSLVAARALTVGVFAGIVVCGWVLVWRCRPRAGRTSLASSAAVLLLAASPFCFVFTRLAILEPMLILWMLLALLVAGMARPAESLGETFHANRWPIMALGLLLPVMVLTKTTALFLVPAIAWMLFAAVGYRLVTLMRVGLAAAGIGLTLWLAYFALLVRPHFLLDYRYLFSANAYTGITGENFFRVIADTVRDGMWMGQVIYPAALVALGVAVASLRRLRAHPLIPALILWASGYTAFLAYHNNLQPRYYLVVVVPITLLVPVVIEDLLLPWLRSDGALRVGMVAAAALILTIAIPDALQTTGFVRHPEYTLLNAAREVNDYIVADERRDPSHNPLVLSISGSELSLMTGMHSICDDFGTLELPDRVKKYRPGWYIAWNQIDDDKMDAMTPLFHIERVAAFPAMDDPDRNLMILYRLDPSIPTPLRLRKGKPTPNPLRTRVGQQPSTTQLEH